MVNGWRRQNPFFNGYMGNVAWFPHRRIAVSLVACGNYLSGTVWPPLIQHSIATDGWRVTHFVIGLICLAGILPLSSVLSVST